MAGIGGFARTTPDAAAIVSFGLTLTFGELERRQRALVAALRKAGLRRGDRVAVLAANRPEALEVTTGVLRAAIVPVPINPLLTEPEIAYLLDDSGARWLFTDRSVEPRPSLQRIVTFGDAYERLLHSAAEKSPPRSMRIANFMLGRPMHYTSGTTGEPKGVWVRPHPERRAAVLSESFRMMWGLHADDVHLVCSPLAHSAPHRFAARTLEAGGTVVLQKKFDAEETYTALDMFSVTTTFMVPTHLERIVALGWRVLGTRDLSTLRLLAHAGAPIREETKRRVIEVFPSGSVWEFYGATEGQATRISTEEWLRKPGSVGTANPGAEILVLDERGQRLGPGETGDVWIHDPAAERFSYWRDRRKTRAAWRSGAFTVGDLGCLDDDGYLFLEGRRDDTIITGGVNVYPREVERVFLSHPAVADVVVYGQEDDEWGQIVCAEIVPAFGQPVDPDALRSWARERLAGFKCPRVVEVVEELPHTPTGKVRRRH